MIVLFRNIVFLDFCLNYWWQYTIELTKKEYKFLTPALRKYLNTKNKGMQSYLKNQAVFHSKTPTLTVASCGLGQDSMAILLLLIFDKDFRKKYAPNDLLVLFANTNSEHPYSYEYRDNVIIPLCKKHGIKFISIESSMGYHRENWQSLLGQWQNGTPSIGSLAYSRFQNCSHNLKLTPQFSYVEEYLANNYDIENKSRKRNYKAFADKYNRIKWLIGISTLEEERVFDVQRETYKWRKDSIDVLYPLIDIGFTRQSCQEYTKSKGFKIPFPSSCWGCCFGSSHMELMFLEKTYPELFHKWVKAEQNKLDEYEGQTRKVLKYDSKYIDEVTGETIYENERFVEEPVKNLGVSGRLHKDGERKGQAVNLLDVLAEAKAKYPNITLDELNAYKFNHGCVKSQY